MKVLRISLIICFVCFLSLFSACYNKQETEYEQFNKSEIIDHQVIKQKIINLDGEEGALTDHIPMYGDVNMISTLSDALNNPEYSDYLFDVTITVVSMDFAFFEYNGMTLYELEHSEVKKNRDNDEIEWISFCEEYHDFYEWVTETKGAETAEKYRNWEEQYSQAYGAFNDLQVGSKEYKILTEKVENAIKDEYVYLIESGYDVAVNGNQFSGYLTKEQIDNFPYNSKYGYFVGWSDMDSGKEK